jgi:UDP-N-acetylglucosamine 2-epimerase (non-hydrolysing)
MAPTQNVVERIHPRAMVVYGTRPEAIKLAPVVHALQASRVHPVVAVTGQHPDLLDQVNGLFGIEPDVKLGIFRHGQSLSSLTSRILEGLTAVLDQARPDAVIVQGDTTTTFAAALAAFYARIPVVHVEAGLRTGDLGQPFPEEANRCLTGRIASLHLAATDAARTNLLREGVSSTDVAVTGNTVIDALQAVVRRRPPVREPAVREALADHRRVLLVTAHRRENWGEGMKRISAAIADLARRPDVLVVVPAHPNPNVRRDLMSHIDERSANVRFVEPLEYGDMAQLLARADIALSDSGGLQEEAPSVGTPTLVLRDTTERAEAVQAGSAELVGTDPQRILAAATKLLDNGEHYRRMATVANPFGDGQASLRTAAAVEELLGVGQRLPDFEPMSAASSPRGLESSWQRIQRATA